MGFIMAFVGASVVLLIGMLIFGQVSDTISCDLHDERLVQQCENAKDTAWTVVGILPIALFFALFAIFGGMDGDGLPSIRMPKLKRIGSGQKSLNNYDKKVKKLSVIQKFMLTIGLAKVKNVE